MKLVTYLKDSRTPAVGLVVSSGKTSGEAGKISGEAGKIIDALDAFEWMNTQNNTQPQKRAIAPVDMLTVIREQSEILPAMKRLLSAHSEGSLPKSLLLDEKSLTLLSPIPNPLSMRDGYAFRQHVEAARRN